ncbi:MAG: pro-sigmaK processing inhibitor BofA family protein [Selenomonadaceae bacterium]|nr:pro-sigmaK processing inhibitor BofA family protein [Selenomonadaceae bacterium]MBR1859327.1 pro-sigmaK processing inhibitor BofA family protein [Selenomonadaceae bacterium]
MEYIAGVVIGIIAIVIIVNLLTLPFQLLFKLIANGILGAVILYLINMIGIVSLKITLINSLIAGIFGIPGVIGLIVYNQFLK